MSNTPSQCPRRILRPLIAMLVVITLSACTPSMSQQHYRLGQTAFKQHNYTTAFMRNQAAAAMGNVNAMYVVGYMYYYGLGVPQDNKAAQYWLRLAAKQGNAKAKHALEMINFRGKRSKLANN